MTRTKKGKTPRILENQGLSGQGLSTSQVQALIPKIVFPIACSDETTPLSAGVQKATMRTPFIFQVTEIRASLTTAQATGDIITIDVKVTSVGSLFTTTLTIDNTEKTSQTAAIPCVLNGTRTLIDNDMEVTIDIVQVNGTGTAATGLKVYLIGTKG